MSPTTARIHRVGTVTVTFARIGHTPPQRGRAEYPPLVVTVPPHTARDRSATVGYLTGMVHRHVEMFMPADVRRYTVAVDIDARGHGAVHLAEALSNVERFRRQPRDLGQGTITPTEPEPRGR